MGSMLMDKMYVISRQKRQGMGSMLMDKMYVISRQKREGMGSMLMDKMIYRKQYLITVQIN
jgi:predicted acetyltransferase